MLPSFLRVDILGGTWYYGFVTHITIDDVKDVGSEKAGPMVRFNVLFHADIDSDMHDYIAIPGFRWIAGCLHPPSSRVGNRYYPVCFLGTSAALAVLQAFKAKLLEMGLNEKYRFADNNTAIEQLVNKSTMCRFFPGVL